MAAPVRGVVEVARRERGRVVAVGHEHAAVGIEAQQLLRARDLRLRQHDDALAAGRPGAHPLRPRRRVRPAAAVGGDRLQHQQLGPVKVPDHRHARRHTDRGLVDRRQVVQVQHVRASRADRLQRPAPGDDLALVLVVIQRGEDAVRRSRPVLIRRMHRRIDRHRVGRRKRRGHVDRPHVQPRVELARVARLPGPRQRAGQHGHVPAGAAQRRRQVACDVRGPSTREEGEPHHRSPLL